MILIDLPARMVCIEKGCGATEPVEVCLMRMGTFLFRPRTDAGKKWQVMLDQANPTAAFMCRCPEHATKLTTPPSAEKSILRSINGH